MTNIKEILKIDGCSITNTGNINVVSVWTGDGYPDYCDAYIEEAEVCENGEWRDATDEELDIINDDTDFVYEAALDYEF